MSEHDYQEICGYLVQVAREAGDMMLMAKPSSLTATSKKNSSYIHPDFCTNQLPLADLFKAADIVTQIDQAVEALIR